MPAVLRRARLTLNEPRASGFGFSLCPGLVHALDRGAADKPGRGVHRLLRPDLRAWLTVFEAYLIVTGGPAAMFRGASLRTSSGCCPAGFPTPHGRIMAVSAIFVGWPLGNDLKVWFSRATRRKRRGMDAAEFGKGGSSAFAGIVEEWGFRYRPGDLLLGRRYRSCGGGSAGRTTGVFDHRRKPRGQGTLLIIPNLLSGRARRSSIDPKGTNAAVTAARRGHGGGRVTEFSGRKSCGRSVRHRRSLAEVALQPARGDRSRIARNSRKRSGCSLMR